MRNSSLVESICAEDITGLRHEPKPRKRADARLVGERSVGRGRCPVRDAGGIRSENAGMSSEKEGENPSGRKSKVSRGRFVRPGGVGT